MDLNRDEQAVIDVLAEANQAVGLFAIVHALAPQPDPAVDGHSREARACRDRNIQLIRTIIAMWEHGLLVEVHTDLGGTFFRLPGSEAGIDCPQCHQPLGRPHTEYCTLAPGKVWDGVLAPARAYPAAEPGDCGHCTSRTTP